VGRVVTPGGKRVAGGVLPVYCTGMAAVHPRRDEAVAYALAHPDVSYGEVAKLYGVNVNSIGAWVTRRRKALGTLAAPLRTPGSRPAPPNLTVLPQPEPKLALPPDLAKLARGVVRLALVTMRARLKEGDANIADAAKALAAVTDRLDVFGAITREQAEPVAAGAALLDAASVASMFRQRQRAAKA